MSKHPLGATYRVQLHAGFTFDDAAGIAPYLAELGVTHLYCSPYLAAAPGSTHGYDVIAHDRLNEELGGSAGFARMCEALAAAGLGQVVDIVPNHMAISSPDNRWWWDVLKNGPNSAYAPYFDIDWDPPEPKLRHTILMPILGDHYGRVIARGEIVVDPTGEEPVVRYFDHVAPLAPASVEKFLGDDLVAGAGRVTRDADLLHELLEAQSYRLAYWRTAMAELDYRRFFDVNTLVALRQEDPRVFEATHGLILELVRAGKVDGLRVDHVDGLRDPGAYLERLRTESGDAYLVVEKILEREESIPDAWPVEGTTGYDFLNRAGGLMVDPAGAGAMTAAYEDFIGESLDYPDVVHDKKLLVERAILASDVERLVGLLADVCESTPKYRDYTRVELRDVVSEVLACFPVYRTYVTTRRRPREEDVSYVERALEAVTRRRPDIDSELISFLRGILLLEYPGAEAVELALRFQQTSGPVTAKGVEDTAFYNYNRLISLNEVGGDPGSFGTSVEDFHRANLDVAARRPATLLATSTHDTKRSEDVRARISLLSEIPNEWIGAVRRWSATNERHRTGEMPDRNIEYLLYQTLVGAWPIDAGRLLQFAEKAAKEAKAHTSWIDPSEAYDGSLRAFVEGIMANEAFTSDLADFVAPLVAPGRVNALAQVLLKLTSPGIPDVYQGCDLWDDSLVDPDNRRPIDYARRSALLSEVKAMSGPQAWARPDDGAPKLLTIARALGVRAAHSQCFGPGSSYEPLYATGAHAGRVVAFVRARSVATVVPRLPLHGACNDTTISLPEGRWVNVLADESLDGGDVPIDRLLRSFPVALLTRT